jgi:predicted phosphodiesterase
MKKRITFISDTHTKHDKLNGFLPGGDILIHAGDLTSRGYITEVEYFMKWYDKINKYYHCLHKNEFLITVIFRLNDFMEAIFGVTRDSATSRKILYDIKKRVSFTSFSPSYILSTV